MGAVVECFRNFPGAKRSNHPIVSFIAVGGEADRVVENHELDYGFGETSPLARLYDLDAWLLLLGVGHTNNSSLHLVEYRADFKGKRWYHIGTPGFH
jgi:aminoglycoside 3-N-acetyltransferase